MLDSPSLAVQVLLLYISPFGIIILCSVLSVQSTGRTVGSHTPCTCCRCCTDCALGVLWRISLSRHFQSHDEILEATCTHTYTHTCSGCKYPTGRGVITQTGFHSRGRLDQISISTHVVNFDGKSHALVVVKMDGSFYVPLNFTPSTDIRIFDDAADPCAPTSRRTRFCPNRRRRCRF